MGATQQGLKIYILAHEPSPTVTNSFVPRGRARGHTVVPVDLSEILISDLEHDPIINSLRDGDLIFYRTTGWPPLTAFTLSRMIGAWGIPSINAVFHKEPYINRKSYQAYLVGNIRERQPKTYGAAKPEYARICEVIGSPFVAKLDLSSQGRDVHMITSEDDFRALPVATPHNRYIFQECVPHTHDYRVHVINKKAVAMYTRIPKAGDFRANVSRGGAMAPVEPEMQPRLVEIAERIAPVFASDIYALDFMPSTKDGELYFTEMNDNYGWEHADANVTDVDLAELTLDFFELRAKERGELDGLN